MMGNTNCNPTSNTMQSLLSVAQAGGIIPDITLDRTLNGYLSINSEVTLTTHYLAVQQRLSSEQLAMFNQNLTSTFGGARVAFGNVGIIALALSMFFDAVANDILGLSGSDQIQRMFGSSETSIGSIVGEYLRKVPSLANDSEAMADITELCDQDLKFELIDLFERMTLHRQLSSRAIKQWLNGAAIHLHTRIHGIRLHSVPLGSAESLRLSYSTAFPSLMRRYTGYLRRHIRVTPPSTQTFTPGYLVIEPNRNVSHWIRHSPCEAQGIQNSMLMQIIAAQHMQMSQDYLELLGKNIVPLVGQSTAFTLQENKS